MTSDSRTVITTEPVGAPKRACLYPERVFMTWESCRSHPESCVVSLPSRNNDNPRGSILFIIAGS